MILKRIASYVVSLLVIVSMLLGTSTAFALGTATQRLEDIQQITGFVPGESSIIQNNCYGFASEVCQKLYGVAYKEGLYNNFRVKQSSGNYQTVGVFTSPNTSADSKFAQQVKDFFVSRAVAGDVVPAGSDPAASVGSAVSSEEPPVVVENIGIASRRSECDG